jgi:hypothetical protein
MTVMLRQVKQARSYIKELVGGALCEGDVIIGVKCINSMQCWVGFSSVFTSRHAWCFLFCILLPPEAPLLLSFYLGVLEEEALWLLFLFLSFSCSIYLVQVTYLPPFWLFSHRCLSHLYGGYLCPGGNPA